jgi:hypothetical protein
LASQYTVRLLCTELKQVQALTQPNRWFKFGGGFGPYHS